MGKDQDAKAGIGVPFLYIAEKEYLDGTPDYQKTKEYHVMFMRQDWLMRQIEVLTAAVSQLVFGKGELERENHDVEGQFGTSMLEGELTKLLEIKDIGKAENILFERLDPSEQGSLALAVEFYHRLNQLTDGELEHGGFSREEILEGLKDVTDCFGLYLPGLL